LKFKVISISVDNFRRQRHRDDNKTGLRALESDVAEHCIGAIRAMSTISAF
jgi:hypothetical protein